MEKRKALIPFDAADYLDSPAAVAAYIEAALETGDTAFIVDALGVVARAKGMTELSRSAGLSRESLYKALSQAGNPEFTTVLKVITAMGLKLSVEVSDVTSKPATKSKAKPPGIVSTKSVLKQKTGTSLKARTAA